MYIAKIYSVLKSNYKKTLSNIVTISAEYKQSVYDSMQDSKVNLT